VNSGKELAVVGREDFTLGFQLAGVRKAYPVADAEELEKRVADVLDADDVGILVVEASDVDKLTPATKRRLQASLEPVVIQMGGEGGDLREKVKRAIGIDLYKEK
jgi:V/A-type H+-transporting ATPase subunit F